MTRTRLLWLLLIVCAAFVQGYALGDGIPGNTFSGEVQNLLRAYPMARLALAGFLVWLAWHWLFEEGRRR